MAAPTEPIERPYPDEPLLRSKEGWWFADCEWASFFGPFDTEHEARIELALYDHEMTYGPRILHKMDAVLAYINGELLKGRELNGSFPESFYMVDFPQAQVEYVEANNIATASGHKIEFKTLKGEGKMEQITWDPIHGARKITE